LVHFFIVVLAGMVYQQVKPQFYSYHAVGTLLIQKMAFGGQVYEKTYT